MSALGLETDAGKMREQDWKAQQHSANAGPGSLTGCQCPGGAERPPTTCFSETWKENEEGQAGGTAGGETGAEEVKKTKPVPAAANHNCQV